MLVVYEMKRVLVFGTFDGLHPGHFDFFRQARELGDKLVVVVGRDETVQKVKGHLPKRNESERLELVRKIDIIDESRLGNFGDPYLVIKQIQPDIIALGYDQNSFTRNLPEFIKKEHLNIEIVCLKAFKPMIYKSSLLKK